MTAIIYDIELKEREHLVSQPSYLVSSSPELSTMKIHQAVWLQLSLKVKAIPPSRDFPLMLNTSNILPSQISFKNANR